MAGILRRTGTSLLAPDGGGLRADEVRLVQLFQNRAGLKKAYADLKDEVYSLRDRLKQQEGAAIRIQEQLDALADLLADPATGFGALVFFQLRGLWKICHQQLAGFATKLSRTQQARETARHEARCDEARSARLADVDRRLASAVGEADLQRRQLAGAQQELRRLTAFWHTFERRRRNKSLEILHRSAAVADALVGNLQAERGTIGSEANDEFPGISLAARRNINLAIIGYAEHLCETVDAFGLTAQAKEADARRVQEMTFGGRSECEEYMQRVQKARSAVAGQKHITNIVKIKMERLRPTCEYRSSSDTVPVADSLTVAGQPAVWNVLVEDYWDLYTLLLR